MKYVYRLKIISGGIIVADMLFRNEKDAEAYSDSYRESKYPYTVIVTRTEVH